MADLTERLLDPATFEGALREILSWEDDEVPISHRRTLRKDIVPSATIPLTVTICELHRLLATAKAEGAAEALEKICMDVRCGGHAYSARIHLDDGTYYKLGVVDASVIFAHAADIRKGLARAGGGR